MTQKTPRAAAYILWLMTVNALHEDRDAWEKLSAEALENFEKRFES